MKLSQKWLEKFGGYENETEGVSYGVPGFQGIGKVLLLSQGKAL